MELLVNMRIKHKLADEEVEALKELGAEKVREMYKEKEEDMRHELASEMDVLPEEFEQIDITIMHEGKEWSGN